MIRVDAFLVADAAQVVGAKLNLLGGGWNNLTIQNPDGIVPLIAVAGRIVVPLEEAENVHDLMIQLLDTEGSPIIEHPPRMTIAGVRDDEFSENDPKEFAVPFAIDVFGLAFPRPGDYAFTISRGDEELARTSFRVRFQS